MESGDIGFGRKGTSSNKFHNHSTSLLAIAKATNLAVIVESVIQVCFLNAQDSTHHQVSIYNLM